MKNENKGIVKYELNEPAEVAKMAIVVKEHIVKQNLFTPIVGKNYVQVEGWQFAGGLLGLFPRVVSVENLSSANEIKWKAEVEIVNLGTKEIISRGFAVCSNKEGKKVKFDEYAILSMAQTRAVGKAYRNIIGWIMKLAGYESTPSEEITKVGEEPAQVKTEVKSDDKITEEEADKLLSLGISAGFSSKAKFIASIKSKKDIKELTDLTRSEADKITMQLLKKQASKKL